MRDRQRLKRTDERSQDYLQDILQQLITLFVSGLPEGSQARTSVKLCRINFKTAVQWYHQLRTIIYTHVQKEHYVFDGSIEVDENYF